MGVAACESARFGGGSEPVRTAVRRPPPASVAPEPVEAIPSGSVTSEPLAPIPGAGPAPSGPGAFGNNGPVLADVPQTPVQPRAPETITPVPSTPPAPPAGSGGRTANVGGWTARDATGATCRLTLSSSPALDLYRASSSGCANRDLARVTAWDFRDGEVYLYQPGGAVAARLRQDGGGLAGVVAKSGAPLTLVR